MAGSGSRLQRLVSCRDIRTAAVRRLPGPLFDYVDGGAEDEVTLRANEAAFRSVGFRPHMAVWNPAPQLEVVAAVGGSVEIQLDSGVRRGSDVLKALALGARAVLVGRSAVYGLAVAGSEGVSWVLDLLRTNMLRSMRLMGLTSVPAFDASWIEIHMARGVRNSALTSGRACAAAKPQTARVPNYVRYR